MIGIRAWVCLAVVPAMMVVSCEKIREITSKKKGGETEEGSDAATIAEPGGETAPESAALVDRNELGYRFRRDQPFPQRLTVRNEISTEISNGRVFGRSALGTGSSPMEGTWENVLVFDRDGSKVTIRIASDRFVKPIIDTEGEASGQEDSRVAELGESIEGLSGTFIRRDKGWKTLGEQSDFRVMAWATQLAPQLDDYLLGTGVVPNSQWFGSDRMLPGVELVLRGPQTALVLGTPAKGAIKLGFDRVENIGGHPCGVFRWSGEFTIANAATISGEREQQEMSISSGQIWCSLIHPLVLRRESEGVMTVERRGPDRTLVMRIQGAVKERYSLSWTPAE